jgi:hypothetical protein
MAEFPVYFPVDVVVGEVVTVIPWVRAVVSAVT